MKENQNYPYITYEQLDYPFRIWFGFICVEPMQYVIEINVYTIYYIYIYI